MNNQKNNQEATPKTSTAWDKFIQLLKIIMDFLKEIKISHQWQDKNGNPHDFRFGKTIA